VGGVGVPLIAFGGDAAGRKDWRRWYALLVFGLVSASTCAIWATVPAVLEEARTYYGLSDWDVVLTTAWGALAYFPMAVYASYLVTLERGVHSAVVHAAVLSALGAALRCVPTLVHKPSGAAGRILLHAAHCVNAMSGPLVLATPSAVSATWFPARQRAIATGLALAANAAGFAAAFTIGPSIKLRALVFGTAGVALFACLVAAITLPSLPRHAPSVTSVKYRMAIRRSTLRMSASASMPRFAYATVVRFVRSVRATLKRPPSVLLFLAGALQIASATVWGLCLPRVLVSVGVSSDPSWLVVLHSLCAVAGIAFSGFFADLFFRRKIKSFAVVVMLL
jgi:hypothetical protein